MPNIYCCRDSTRLAGNGGCRPPATTNGTDTRPWATEPQPRTLRRVGIPAPPAKRLRPSLSPATVRHTLPGALCDVSRHRNSSEPALGSELFPFGAFGGAGGLVVLGGVEG